MSHKEGGMFPSQINKELAKALLSGTKDVFLEINLHQQSVKGIWGCKFLAVSYFRVTSDLTEYLNMACWFI